MSSRVYTATAAVQITPILSLVSNLHESDGHDIEQIEYILYLGHYEHLDRCVTPWYTWIDMDFRRKKE